LLDVVLLDVVLLEDKVLDEEDEEADATAEDVPDLNPGWFIRSCAAMISCAVRPFVFL